MKNRLLGALVFLFFAATLYYNWHTLRADGSYYPKLSGISPLGVLAGLFMIVAPSLPDAQPVTPGTPAAARRERVILREIPLNLPARRRARETGYK